MSRTRSLCSLAAATAVVAVLGAAVPVHAESRPDEQVRQLLLAQNADMRGALLKAWLAPVEARNGLHVRSLIDDLYTSEVRLFALGLDRKMIVVGTTREEVPYHVLAERAGIELDVWTPFAGRTFAVPGEFAQ